MYFYYAKKLGKLMPRKSDTHPSERLDKEQVVGEVVKLSPQQVLYSLSELSKLFPKEPKNDER